MISKNSVIDMLSTELFVQICGYLSMDDIKYVILVNRQWKQIVEEYCLLKWFPESKGSKNALVWVQDKYENIKNQIIKKELDVSNPGRVKKSFGKFVDHQELAILFCRSYPAFFDCFFSNRVFCSLRFLHENLCELMKILDQNSGSEGDIVIDINQMAHSSIQKN